MIYAYIGTPGSGKSLHAARELIKQDSRNLPTILNYSVNPACLLHPENVFLPDDSLSPEMLIGFSRWFFHTRGVSRPEEGQILLIIDEAQVLFNARSWNEKGRADWVRFFSQHRKYGFDVILITQYIEMLDKQIRALIEYSVVHRSMSNFMGNRILGAFLKLFMGTFQVSVFWYHTKMRVISYRVMNYEKYFSVYDTFALFDEEEKVHVKKLGKKSASWPWASQ